MISTLTGRAAGVEAGASVVFVGVAGKDHARRHGVMSTQGFLDDSQAQRRMQITRDPQPKMPRAGAVAEQVMRESHVGVDQPT